MIVEGNSERNALNIDDLGEMLLRIVVVMSHLVITTYFKKSDICGKSEIEFK